MYKYLNSDENSQNNNSDKEKQTIVKTCFQPWFIKKHLLKYNNPFVKSLYLLALDLKGEDKLDLEGNDKKSQFNFDAERLRKLRNNLEHNWVMVTNSKRNISDHDYAFRISKAELHELSIKTFKIARSSMLYFTFAINHEEKMKSNKNTSTLTISMDTQLWDPKLDL